MGGSGSTRWQNHSRKVTVEECLSISAMDLDQLFISKYVSSKTNNRPNYAFSVVARLRTGSEITLVKGLRQPEQATYVEQQIEKFLQIEDRPMEGEYRIGN